MKKKGFTLAEVLVALGIIGVVAAITLPTFTASTANAKIGPSLATAVANFEQANAAMLQDNRTEKISDLAENPMGYAHILENYMKVSVTENNIAILTTKTGTTYYVGFTGAANRATANEGISQNAAHRLYLGTVTVDINGNAAPNSYGKDQFIFGLFEDGSLRPKGGHPSWNNTDNNFWDTKCKNNAEPESAGYCAGSIFENNLKVLYN